MARKLVAGMLLLATAAWAELALAPLLAIYAHVHEQQVASHVGAHHPATAAGTAGHACCPGAHHTDEQAAFEIVAESSDCHDSHRCCFRQGPQSVPAPVSEARQLGPQLSSTTSIPATVKADSSYPTDVEMEAASPPFPQVFGMTLRV